MKKVFSFTLDTKRPCLSRLRGLVDGDTENEFDITVTDDGEPVLIPSSNTRVDAIFTRSDGKIDDIADVQYDDAYVTLDNIPATYLRAGVNTLELIVYQLNDGEWTKILTTQPIEIYVRQKKEIS